MTHVWTNIPKPTGTSWTNIPKPSLMSGTMVSMTAGVPMGLLMAITYPITSSVVTGTTWTNIPKPTGTVWTNISKAT